MAVSCDGASLTYGELDRLSTKIARACVAHGVKPGAFVGLYFRKSVNLFAAMLGVLKAGAAYVPMDPRFPAERIRDICEDAGITLALSEGALGREIEEPVKSVKWLLVDGKYERSGRRRTEPKQKHLGPRSASPCYAIYTLGSTGRPKGVKITHRNALTFVRALRRSYGVKRSDRIYQGFSVAFDASVEEIWAAFSVGATLVAATEEISRSPVDAADFIDREKITYFSTVPSFLSMIPRDLPSVRLLVLGGEACPPDLVNRWAKPGRRMLNTYGRTEATVVATLWECVPGQPVSIGKPLHGYRAYVLDPDGKPVKNGEEGELYIGGPAVAAGYIDRPELTAERFVDDTLAGPNRRAKLYRTSDMVRLGDDGEIYFHGRIFDPSETLSVLVGRSCPDFLRDETLVDIFDATAGQHGERIALKFRGRSISYAELANATKSAAAQLAALGVAPGDRVGVWCDQGPLVHAAMIGVMRAGAVYVPFHRDIPLERLALAIEDAGIKILVVDKNTSALCEGLSTQQLILSEDLFDRDEPAAELQSRPFAQPGALAYIIYTSGSTGRPKGVMVSHAQASHWLRSEHSELGIHESDVVYQGFSPAFDMSIEEIWTSFLAGASLVVAEADVAKDVEAIGPFLREHAVTVLHAVPSLAGLIDPDVPALRLLNLGGEAVTEAVVSRWARPGFRIVNTYGPTEGTVSCTLGELRPDEPVTIGKPLPNYRIYITGDDGRLVPRGQAGELCIGGPSVATGYVGLPALNSERFKPDPFSAEGESGARMYRTGDRAMIGLDGQINFLGRLDGQVKIRGYRVELGEIEKVLDAAPNVKLASITTRTDAMDQTEIIGFVVPMQDQAFDIAELRKYLRKHLNSYMIPSQIHVVDALPRMASGKLDRQGLMAKIVSRKVSNENFTPREQQLAGALRPLLGEVDLEPHSDFFDDLGGHSLLMAKFVSILRRRPDMAKISLRDIYRTRNLRALASLIDSQAAINEHAPAIEAQTHSSGTNLRYILCGAAQAVALIIIFGFVAAAWVTPFFAYLITYEWTDSILSSSLAAAISMFALPFVLLLGGIGGKWLIVGRIKAGDYPLWGAYYFRCWLVDRLVDLMPLGLLANSPLYAPVLAALGARIGNDVHLGSCTIGAIDLVTIGDGSSVGNGVHINNKMFDSHMMRVRPVVLGRNTYVGPSAVLNGGCQIGDHSEIGDMAQVAAGAEIGSGEILGWFASPENGNLRYRNPRLSKAQSCSPRLSARPLSLPSGLIGAVWFCAHVACYYHDNPARQARR